MLMRTRRLHSSIDPDPPALPAPRRLSMETRQQKVPVARTRKCDETAINGLNQKAPRGYAVGYECILPGGGCWNNYLLSASPGLECNLSL